MLYTFVAEVKLDPRMHFSQRLHQLVFVHNQFAPLSPVAIDPHQEIIAAVIGDVPTVVAEAIFIKRPERTDL